jgi:hypothetical protein
MQTGQCYCGAVRYELDGELGALVNCHCRSCRRVHGAAFSTVALVRSAEFRVTAGASDVRERRHAGGARTFCVHCGGRLWNRPAANDAWLALVVATLDVEPETPPIVESKAPWYHIADALPQYPGFPPGVSERVRS